MEQDQFQTLLAFFKSLANETRLKIIGLLANAERSVGELAELLGVKEPTVSHHLAQLRELGLVQMRPAGNTHFYVLNTRALESMSRTMFSVGQIASLTRPLSEDAWEQKVLDAFMEGERIRELPAKEKKFKVILQWLVQKFEPGVRYHELEVNEIIRRHHEDCASLRRAMVEYGYMSRERNTYWRNVEPA